MKSLIYAVLVTAFLVLPAQGQSFPNQKLPSIGYASPIQDNENTTDWKEAYEKLEIRLRELEDDFVKRREQTDSENETNAEFTESTIKELKELGESIDSISGSVEEIEDTLPGMVYTTRKTGPRMELFGRIHTSYFAYPDVDPGLAPVLGANPQDAFGFRRVRIGVRGDIKDNTFYRIETEFADANNFQFRDVVLGFRNLPLLRTLTIGNHKRPYSLDQLNSSNCNVFTDRPFVADAFNDNNRRFGISSSGFSEDLRYNWHSGVYNMENIQDDGMFVGDDYQLELASRWAATPWYDQCSNGRGYMHWAIASAQRFPDGLGANNASEYSSLAEALTPNILDTGTLVGAESESLYGLEFVLNVGAFQMGAEYMETFVDRLAGPNLNFHGGYVYASYMLTGEHMPWNRKTGTLGCVKPFENFFAVRDCNCNVARGWGAWQIGARYSYLDLNDEDIVGGQAESLTLALNWYWNEYSRMQFNYMNGDLNRLPLAEGNYDIFALQFEIFF